MRSGLDWSDFSGAPSEDVLRFVQSVYRVSFANDRLDDDAWMARYAYGCLMGDALHWHESLENDVKDCWPKLRQAIIERFPPMPLIPNAPAAAPVLGSAPLSPTSRCRVLVVRGNGIVIGYVGPLALYEDTVFQKSPDGALILDVPVLQQSQEARSLIRMLPPSQQAVAYPFVGVECHGSFWNLRACDEGRPEKVFKGRAGAYTPRGVVVASSRIWSIHVDKTAGLSEELCMEWVDDNDKSAPIQVCTRTSHIDSESAPMTFWMRKSLLDDEEPLKLILERF
ncbi:hypothetical protein FRB95_010233 [Tulasnella sp. JGI-2019a]|nr:hypothetical protein FRB95_010233 [Tulasnella sp. JGI-2019a]